MGRPVTVDLFPTRSRPIPFAERSRARILLAGGRGDGKQIERLHDPPLPQRRNQLRTRRTEIAPVAHLHLGLETGAFKAGKLRLELQCPVIGRERLDETPHLPQHVAATEPGLREIRSHRDGHLIGPERVVVALELA
jgi:hypothetical protein